MSEKLDYARAEIENLLAQAEKVFIKEQGMKLTFIARHPTIQERYMIITSDEVPALALFMGYVLSKEPAPSSR